MDKQSRFKETKSSEGAFEGRDFYRESLSKLRLVRELQREENIISADRCGFNSIQFNLNDYKNDISKLNSKLKEIRNRFNSWDI